MISDIDTSDKTFAKAFEYSLHTMTDKQPMGGDTTKLTGQSTPSFIRSNTAAFYHPLRGTIIPKEWKTLTTSSGKKLSRGALELYAIIVSWYNCKKVLDKKTGGYKFVPKFEGDEFRKNYDYFTKELDRSQEQVRRYFVELKATGLISYEVKTVTYGNWKYHNTICICLNKNAPHFLKENSPGNLDCIVTSETHKTSPEISAPLQATDQTPEVFDLDTLQDNKKNWPSPCKKVDLAPQKSGASYIEDKTTLNLKLDLVDLNESNFLKQNEISPLSSNAATGESTKHLERKPLSKFHPISDEEVACLQKASNRDFSKSYINKLLLKLSDAKPDHGFYTKRLFLSYMTKALSNELRSTINANNTDFSFAMPKEVRAIENYLNNIESSSFTDNITRLKKKIIGGFETTTAYSMLKNLTFDYITDKKNNESEPCNIHIVKITQNNLSIKKSDFTLSKGRQDKITKLILEVFGKSTKVIFDLRCDKTQNTQSLDFIQNLAHHKARPIFHKEAIPEPATFEEKLLRLLETRYGSNIYNSWFSELKVTIEDAISSSSKVIDNHGVTQDSTQIGKLKAKISIFAPTAFARDYISTNYGHKIESLISELMTSDDSYKNYYLGRGGVVWV